MADANDFIRTVKQAAKEAVNAAAPSDVMTGTVTGLNPITVRVEQKFEVTEPLLIVPEYLTDHKIDVTISWTTENEGNPGHSHDLTGKKSLVLHNALKSGDRVVLVRQSGGQKFLMIDRMV